MWCSVLQCVYIVYGEEGAVYIGIYPGRRRASNPIRVHGEQGAVYRTICIWGAVYRTICTPGGEEGAVGGE